MAKETPISWTDHSWPIARGCHKKSAGCKFCYMMRDGDRWKYDGNTVKRTGKHAFNLPKRIQGTSKVWPGQPLIFTSSITDMLIEEIDSYRPEIWDMIRKYNHPIYQVLTKRPERFAGNMPPDWGTGYKHVWLGVSVENQEMADERIPLLIQTPAHIRFLSVEPLLGPVDIEKYLWLNAGDNNKYCNDCGDPAKTACDNTHCQFKKIHWVIIGGESGNDNGPWGYRPCQLEWIEQVIADCKKHKVPVFVKQLGTHLGKELKISRHAKLLHEFPKHLQIRQFPNI